MNKSENYKLGERIKRLRRRRRWNQEQLSLKAFGHKKVSRISDIETGRAENPGIRDLEKIAGALEISLSELFRSKDEAEVQETQEERLLTLIGELLKHRDVLAKDPTRVDHLVGWVQDFLSDVRREEEERRRK